MKHKFIFVISFLVVIIYLYFFYPRNDIDKLMLNFECYAERYRILGENESPPYENTILRYQTELDGKGFYSINGTFDDGEQKFIISRTVSFNYIPFGKDTYQIKIDKVEKNQRDDLPEILYKQYFLDRDNLSQKSKVTPLGSDAYILGNIMTPLVICTRLR